MIKAMALAFRKELERQLNKYRPPPCFSGVAPGYHLYNDVVLGGNEALAFRKALEQQGNEVRLSKVKAYLLDELGVNPTKEELRPRICSISLTLSAIAMPTKSSLPNHCLAITSSAFMAHIFVDACSLSVHLRSTVQRGLQSSTHGGMMRASLTCTNITTGQDAHRTRNLFASTDSSWARSGMVKTTATSWRVENSEAWSAPATACVVSGSQFGRSRVSGSVCTARALRRSPRLR